MEKIVHKELAQYKAASVLRVVNVIGASLSKFMLRKGIDFEHKRLHDLVFVKYNQTLHRRVHEGGDDLTWRTVYQASGLDEPRQYTRRHKRKQVGSGEGQVGTSTNLSKRAKGVAAKNKGKRVGVVEEAEAIRRF
ncbi:hypothetical protein SESBI_27788 [Sesbania bispinosa]|nr:hypothetical protein SESBI_27788 [Sesbania bispinosa]